MAATSWKSGLLEDSLKNAFYFHLRNKLTDLFLLENNIRIYTELNTGVGERIDLAVVRINNDEEKHLSARIIEYLAVIELKYKSAQTTINPFFSDIQKAKNYLKRKNYNNCQYYLGFIHEVEYSLKEISWLTVKQQRTWAAGCLTELSGFYNEDKEVFTILSHNEMNDDLNHIVV